MANVVAAPDGVKFHATSRLFVRATCFAVGRDPAEMNCSSVVAVAHRDCALDDGNHTRYILQN